MKHTPILWREIQRKNFTNLDALAGFLGLSKKDFALLLKNPRFSLSLPLRLAQKICKGTLDDPILRQFVPLQEEEVHQDGFVLDPVGDLQAKRSDKLLQKYHGRSLLLTTSACAMHCRYCFRKNYPYETSKPIYDQELEILRKDESIQEVILSGGDPLSLSDKIIKNLLLALEEIPHIQRIRFHTRFLIGIPERIDESFLEVLKLASKQLIFVLHTNHPLELDPEVLFAVTQLRSIGILVLNQSVLLKGVNDDEKTLLALSEALINHGVLPYYLHLLDKVSGSAHLEVCEERAKQLIRYLHENLSGYGVPKLAREIEGERGKTLVF